MSLNVEQMILHPRNVSLHDFFFFLIHSDVVQQRPERLISRLRTISLEDTGPKLTVVRQPRGPDGTRGFGQERPPHTPGAIQE